MYRISVAVEHDSWTTSTSGEQRRFVLVALQPPSGVAIHLSPTLWPSRQRPQDRTLRVRSGRMATRPTEMRNSAECRSRILEVVLAEKSDILRTQALRNAPSLDAAEDAPAELAASPAS